MLVEDDALRFEQSSLLETMRRNAAARVDYALPRHFARRVPQMMHSVADDTRGTAGKRRDRPISGHAPGRHLANQVVDTIVEG